MTFHIQHGYGKGDKIVRASLLAPVSGLVLSPADEEPDALSATARTLPEATSILVDPQSYVYSIPGGSGRCHPSHDLEFRDLAWHQGPDVTEHHVRRVLALNQRIDSTSIISPSPLVSALPDTWAGLALAYARATLAAADRPTLVTVAVHDTAFTNWTGTMQVIDALTTLEAEGFYLVVAQDGSYPNRWDARRLAGVLRFIYTLTELNGYRVVWGYSDIAGALLGRSLAAEPASGWFYSLRYFASGKWTPSSGGRPSNPRAFGRGLLAPIEILTQGNELVASQFGNRVFPHDMTHEFASDSTPDRSLAQTLHMVNIAHLANEVDPDTPISGRLDGAAAAIAAGLLLAKDLDDEGILVDPSHTTRLQTFSQALSEFRSAEGV